MRPYLLGGALLAAAFLFLNREKVATMTGIREPMGVRNNNPLNIRKGNDWKGEVEPDHNRNYEAFSHVKYGFRAGARILYSYNRRGLHTIQQIVDVFAPHGDNNDPTHYANMVSKWTGIAKNVPVNVNDADTVAKLLQAMGRMEVGRTYPFDTVLEGVQMA
ncbi:virion protein [Enterovibrio norvegicus]|uniref:virion protein n=1 Tax=Enterovibrio norvegicus TaxID=188144 RepID=UPI003553B4B0